MNPRLSPLKTKRGQFAVRAMHPFPAMRFSRPSGLSHSASVPSIPCPAKLSGHQAVKEIIVDNSNPRASALKLIAEHVKEKAASGVSIVVAGPRRLTPTEEERPPTVGRMSGGGTGQLSRDHQSKYSYVWINTCPRYSVSCIRWENHPRSCTPQRGGANFERSLSGYRRVKPAASKKPRLGSPFYSSQATRARANAKPGKFGRSAAAGEQRRRSSGRCNLRFRHIPADLRPRCSRSATISGVCINPFLITHYPQPI